MKTLIRLIAVIFLMITAKGVFAQTYETHSEFPETHNNSTVKNPVARCSISGHLATSGNANDGSFVYAGTTVNHWYACVMVADSNGAELFVKQFATTATNVAEVRGINFDSNEDILILLNFRSTLTVEGTDYTSMGESDMLFIIYNSTGIHQDTYHIGGTEHIVLNDVDVAPNGEYRLVGSFENDLWIDGVNTTAVATGNEDFLLLSLNSGGYVWSNQVGIAGGAGDDEGYSIVCDDNGNNYCAFHFYGSNVPFGNGIIRTVKGARDWAVAKYSNTGICQMVFQFGGSSDEHEQGHIALFGTKIFFQGRVSSANSFYCVNADNSIFSTFATNTGNMRNAICSWMDFSTGMILSSGRMLSSSGDINIVSVAITNDTANCASGYGGTLTIDDGFGNNTVTFTGGGIGWAKIAVDGIATSVHQFDATTIAYGTLSDPGANRVYVALRGGTNVDLDPDPNVTVPLASDKRGIAKYDCNPLVGPDANFSGTPTSLEEGETVSFTDLSGDGTYPITSWNWTFEGGTPGTFSGENPPSITYNSAGSYDVTLVVSDGSLSDTELKVDYITVTAAPVAPTANFSGTPTTLMEGETVSFTDASTQGTNPITSWDWTFEGGTPGTFSGENPPSITYNSAGSYDVTLTVSDGSLPDTETKTDYIQVNAIVAPDAEFSGSPTSGYSPLVVSFTDASSQGTNPITSWDWTFEGGTPGTFSGQSPPDITYDSPGDYDVTLTVSDGSLSDTETKTDYITVLPDGEPIADFSADPLWGILTLTTQFTDESIPGNNPLTSWEWDFGDGNTSDEQHPEHTYNFPGVYTVSLTVSDGNLSNTKVKTDYISIYEELTADAGPDMGLELDQSTQFDGSYSGGSGDITILWEGVNNSIPIDDPTILDPNVGPFSDIDVYHFTLTVTDNITGSESIDEMFVDVILGIGESQYANIKVYPNPSSGLVFINSTTKLDMLRVVDIKGQEIINIKNPDNTTQIDLSSFPSGLYIIKIVSVGRLNTYKIEKR